MTTRGALTIVGQVAGAYLTAGSPWGAAIGSYIGSQIGLAIEGPQQVQGPRIADLKLTASAYGTPIAYIEGHPRVAGSIIWASEKREIATTTEVGGKGGPEAEQTAYTYEIDLLLLVSANPIGGVTRVWSNSKLVYSVLTTASNETLLASVGTEVWRRITVYGGDAAQLPDATYEAAVGVGNAPAYRGRGTVLIEGLQLGGSGQLPNLTFEVFTLATPTTVALTLWSIGNGTPGPDYARQGAPGFAAGTYPVLVPTWNALFGTTFVSVYLAGSGSPAPQPGFDVAAGGGPPVLVPGVSDRSTLVVWRNGSAYTEIYSDNGERVQCDFASSTIAGERSCMCLRGTRIVFGAQSGGADKKVYLHSAAGGGPPSLTSPVLAQGVKRLAIGSTAIYALAADGSAVYELNGGSLALNATIATPATASTVMCDDDGTLWLMAGAALYRRDVSTWTLVQAALPANMQTPADDENGPSVVAGVLYTVRPSGTVPSRIYTAYRALDTRVPLDEPLDDVVSRLCLRAGLTAPQIDVTSLASKLVTGFANGQVNTTRQLLDVLGGAYLFEAVESGGVLRFVLRGGAPAATIAYDSMGASNSDPVEPLPVMRRNDSEAPAQCVVRYINAADDYQDGSESSDRLTGGVGVTVVEVPLALQPAQAKALADVAIMDVAAATLSVGPVALTRDYAALEPTDVVVLADVDGTLYRTRILKISDSGGVRTIEGVLDDASVLTSLAGTTVTGYTNSVTVATPADTMLELLDIPILRDVDDAAGMYAAFSGVTSPWPGAALFTSMDALTYTQLLTCTDSTVMGVCNTVLPNWSGGNVFDEVGSVTVNVGSGTLASATRDEVLDAEANACLIGGEVLQFRTAALQSAGVYTLSGLLRGRRGTEWAQTGHSAGERFVLLRLQGLRRVVLATSDLDAERHYKGVTLGRALATAGDEPFTCVGIGLKPFAPVHLRGSRSAGDLTLTWDRRTRLDTNFTNGAVPLGEASEAYDIEIYTTSGFTTVARTLSATSASVLYTAAQQTTDFGSAQAVVYARVYQRSAIVGRGYALQGQA